MVSAGEAFGPQRRDRLRAGLSCTYDDDSLHLRRKALTRRSLRRTKG